MISQRNLIKARRVAGYIKTCKTMTRNPDFHNNTFRFYSVNYGRNMGKTDFLRILEINRNLLKKLLKTEGK